jgi:hypothetical protein
MLLAISDASVLLDMAETGLLRPLTMLPYHIVVSDFVIEEITREDEKDAIQRLVRQKKLTVLSSTREDLSLNAIDSSRILKTHRRLRTDLPAIHPLVEPEAAAST